MAKQRGILPVSGTLGNITFYELDGQFYARKKSTLSRKRVLTEPGFERTRRSAEELKRASVLASKVYRTLDKGKRKVSLYRKMTGMAKKGFSEGMSEREVEERLNMECKMGNVKCKNEYREEAERGEWKMGNEKCKRKDKEELRGESSKKSNGRKDGKPSELIGRGRAGLSGERNQLNTDREMVKKSRMLSINKKPRLARLRNDLVVIPLRSFRKRTCSQKKIFKE